MIRKINSIQDDMDHAVTYELDDGRRVRLGAYLVHDHGISNVLRDMGLLNEPARPLPVFQDGRQIGTLSSDFDPDHIKSASFLYDPRPGDFKRDGDRWIAASSLGLGDFDAITGFVREPRP